MYKSKYTEFTAYEEPYTDKFYFKYTNETVAIIYVDKDWNMYGDVLDPFQMPVKTFKLDQVDCEKLILIKLPTWRADVKRRSGLDKYDTAMLLYKSRGINLLNNYWFAWAESDKIEDYHPLFNAEIAEARWAKDREEPDYYTFEMPEWRNEKIYEDKEDEGNKDFELPDIVRGCTYE